MTEPGRMFPLPRLLFTKDEGWSAYVAADRHVVAFVHERGLWVEFPGKNLDEATPAEAERVADALINARFEGKVGRHVVVYDAVRERAWLDPA